MTRRRWISAWMEWRGRSLRCDPRTLEQRRADALGALAHVVIGCLRVR